MNASARFLFYLIGIIWCGQTQWADAFPELVRAGYANCIACHQSPTGGGLLTPYGRKLSADVLSFRSQSGEEQFLYGITPPESLNLGGDIRALGLYQNRSTLSNFQFIPMQTDVEAGLTSGSFNVVATAGVDYDGNPISRRHYVQYRASDSVSFRAGRFFPAFGINTENHSVAIRRGIGRDQAGETYNVEAAWITENHDLFVTAVLGRPDNLQWGAEMGAALSSSLFVGNSYKIGVSYYYGTRDVASRHLAGPFAILGFTPHFFLLFETAVQSLTPTNKGLQNQTGVVDYARLDYEFIQGFHIYVTQELSYLNLSSSASVMDNYGIGFQMFPRPHLELNLLWQKQRFGASPFADFAFAMVHFYM